MVKKESLKMKNKITKISASQTFLFKSRCKFCKSGPKFVYYILNKMVTSDSLYKIKDFYDNTAGSARADDFYLEYSIKNRNFSPSYMFDPSSASLRKLPVPNMKYQQNDDRFGTILECGCGKTSWAFTRSNRAHISNRKCSHSVQIKDIMSLYRIIL